MVENLPFDSPTDLLETIVELEDRNFSLIGHFEQSEEDFDEIQRVFKQTEQKIDSQIEQLKSQKELMENTVERLLNRSEGKIQKNSKKKSLFTFQNFNFSVKCSKQVTAIMTKTKS